MRKSATTTVDLSAYSLILATGLCDPTIRPRKEILMTAIKHREPESAAQKWIPVLLICLLGIFGSIALLYFFPAFDALDLMMLLVVTMFAAVGWIRGTIRGIVSIVILYIATGVAALAYRAVTPYVGGVLEAAKFNLAATAAESVTRGSMAVSFVLLTILVWIILEIVAKVAMEDTTIKGIGMLDSLVGILFYAVLGILVAALLFNMIGYGRSRPAHDRAYLRPAFRAVLQVHYMSQSFWFPQGPPPIYVYDLNVQ